MDKLLDFKPLEKVTLPDLGDLQCSGLILVVGPNSSGKSQLLQDIYKRLTGQVRTLVVATHISLTKPPDYGQFAKNLEAAGYFETVFDDDGNAQWRPRTTYLGTGQAVNQIAPNQAQNWHNAYVPFSESSTRRRIEFLNYFGGLFVTALFLERRLTSLNQAPIIDFEIQPPQHDLHALYLDDGARKQLFDELLNSFGKAVWPDTSRGNSLCLRVSDRGVLPTAEDRLSPKKMSAYRSIESEGDGLKSYVAICVALLLGRRPVCLIDEPEMCLHPPQAYNLGNFIGRFGTAADTVTLVSTHSSQILRGVIQTAKDIQIVRMVRSGAAFSAHLVPAEVLAEALSKPTIRAEAILDGIFAQSVVILEADGDRLVYQTAWETLSNELHLDVHFAAVGGTGGIADTCNLYRTLKIPVAVIADIDLVCDPGRLKRILDVMSTPEETAKLVLAARAIMERIKQIPPSVEPAQVAQQLKELSAISGEWENEADVELRRKLTRLTQSLDRMRQLKRKGLEGIPRDIAEPLSQLMKELMRHGVFLVPVGDLEGWLANENIDQSKENKWAWANAASLHIQSTGAKNGDVWDFVRSVGSYLAR